MTITRFDSIATPIQYGTGTDTVRYQGNLVLSLSGGSAILSVDVVAPKGGNPQNNVAIVELRNTALHEAFGSVKNSIEAMFGLFKNGGGLFGNDSFLFEEEGYVYISAELRAVLEAERDRPDQPDRIEARAGQKARRCRLAAGRPRWRWTRSWCPMF